MFINREGELKDLEDLWKAKKAHLIVLYGRRRVGKTALLKFFGRDKKLFYWTATKTTGKRLLASFSAQFQLVKNPKATIPADFSYPSWESALLDVAEHCRANKLLVVFDEIPYAFEADTELPSLLQKLWDNELCDSKINLCLTGSRIGMVEKHVLSSGGPLYGRASAVIWLDPLPPDVLCKFLPRYSPSQLVEVYAITGGVPLYVKLFDDSIPVLANIERELSSSASIIKGEPYFLIHEELKEPMRYVAILEAVGNGKRAQTEIANAVGIEKTHLMPYLHTLEGLRFIKRQVSVTEDPKQSRKGIYVITDMFLKFYFRFIASNSGLLEEGREDKVFAEIASQFDSFVGKNGFEEICQRWLVNEAKKGGLPFDPDVIGKFWDPHVEIDAAALNRKHRSMIICEAKWTNKKCPLSVLDALNKKGEYISQKLGYHVNKMIFSKSGFEPRLIERARIENTRLVALEDIFG